MTALWISPHFDDVVFSCAGSLVTRQARGVRVVVATVFSSGAPAPRYASRRAEDLSTLRAVGAGAVHLGFDDAPARGVRSAFVSLASAAVEPELVRALAVRLKGLAAELEAVEVWLPLGVGGHVDHRAVHEAGAAAFAMSARFYEERPYAFVPALRALRRLELVGGLAGNASSPDDIRSQFRAAGCASLLLGDRDAAPGEIAHRLSSVRTSTGIVLDERVVTFDEDVLARAAGLIEGYASQARWLFGRAPARELWSRLARAPSGRFFEREIRLSGP